MEEQKELQKRRISLLNQHLDNARTFQYKYFEHINSSLEKSETAMLASFFSFSALGINYSINNCPSFEIWLFLSVIIINMVFPLVSNIFKQKKAQHFLNIIRELETPIHEFKVSGNLKSWNEVEKSYSSKFIQFSKQIKKGNKMSKGFTQAYHILRLISFLLLLIGWISLIIPIFKL